MKQGVHPIYFTDAKVICACGNTFTTGSTLQQIKVEICSACHPFFTGQQKLVDTLGQVDKFQKRGAEASQKKEQIEKIKANRAARVQTEVKEKPSLKDLLMQARKQAAS